MKLWFRLPSLCFRERGPGLEGRRSVAVLLAEGRHHLLPGKARQQHTEDTDRLSSG
ncbi:hypothetical protein ACRRTK_004264 [Alexandromys fortis]